MIKGDVLLFALLQKLLRAAHVPKCADRIRGTARYDVRRAAAGTNFTRDVVHHRIEIGALGIVVQIRAEHAIEQDIAGREVQLAWLLYPVLEQHFTAHAQLRGGRRCLAYVVRLHGTDRDDRVRALLQRFAHRKLELARLVAARCESRAIVALDPDLGSAETLGESRQEFEACRQVSQGDSRETV